MIQFKVPIVHFLDREANTMKFCKQCGYEMEDSSSFCPNCGTPAKEENRSFNPVPLILGILGILFGWLFALIGHILSIIGIVLGVKEYKCSGSVSGLIVSIIGELCSIASSIFGMLIMLGMMAALS